MSVLDSTDIGLCMYNCACASVQATEVFLKGRKRLMLQWSNLVKNHRYRCPDYKKLSSSWTLNEVNQKLWFWEQFLSSNVFEDSYNFYEAVVFDFWYDNQFPKRSVWREFTRLWGLPYHQAYLIKCQ